MRILLMQLGLGFSLFSAAALAQQPAAAVAATAIDLQPRSSGTFYIKATLAGFEEASWLVDTGSSLTVITPAMLDQLLKAGQAKYSHELSGTMADGTSLSTQVYRLSGLRLGDSCWIKDVDAAIFPTGTRSIVGMNVLSRLTPFTMSVDPPQLALSQCMPAPVGSTPLTASAGGGPLPQAQAP